MFNRALQVKMVKAKKTDSENTNQSGEQFEGKAEIIGSIVDSSAKKIGALVILYVVADTARKVLIEMAKQ